MSDPSEASSSPVAGRPDGRPDGRALGEMRPVRFLRGFTDTPHGSVLVETGRTRVLCTVSVDEEVPRWMRGRGGGWLTAEYAMLPGSTSPRKQRESVRGKRDGRSVEIGRLIGRSLRAVVDLNALGERTVTVDCDVLVADGGTRTASISGAWVALADACDRLVADGLLERSPLRTQLAAVSVGVVNGAVCLDLPYVEDAAAEVDMNVVIAGGDGSEPELVEVQGTAEKGTFPRSVLDLLLDAAFDGAEQMFALQRAARAGALPGGGGA